MKHLAYILLLILAVSCSSDDDEKNEYIDNNLIAGKWYFIRGSDSIVEIYENGYASYELWDKFQVYKKGDREYGKYRLTKDKLIYDGETSGRSYKLHNDILSIHENNVLWVDYTKVKEGN